MGVKKLNEEICGRRGESLGIEDFDLLFWKHLDDEAERYDLKGIREAVAHPESELSFVYVLDWQGSAEELASVLAGHVLTYEWVIYAGEVRNARPTPDDPMWRYVGKPRVVGRFSTEADAMRAFRAIDPRLEWITEVDDRRNAYLVELGVFSYTPDRLSYSSGLVAMKTYAPNVGKAA